MNENKPSPPHTNPSYVTNSNGNMIAKPMLTATPSNKGILPFGDSIFADDGSIVYVTG